MNKFYCCFFISLISLSPAYCQDNHYWAQQFGARSSLMGGAVIACVRDNSAIYYNPGAIAFIPHKNISISANLYKYETVNFKNGGGTGVGLNSRQIATFPQMISGLFALDHDKFEGGYILMMRNNSSIGFSQSNQGNYKVFSNYNSNQDFFASYELQNNLSEQWAGASLSYKFSDKISVGITPFIAYRFQNFSFDKTARATPTDSTFFIASFDQSRIVSYNSFRGLAKAGLSVDLNKLKLGLTVTTPSVNFYGRGSGKTYLSSHNIDIATGDTAYHSFVSIQNDDDLRINYASPISVSGGIGYHSEKTVLAFSIEWFAANTIYKLTSQNIKPFLKPDNSSVSFKNDFSKTVKSRSVINIAVGFEEHLSKNFMIHAGFRTDYNYMVPTTQQTLFTSFWNVYHFSAGTTFRRHSSEITVGFDYGYSRMRNATQIINLSEPSDRNHLFGYKQNDGDLSFNSLNLVLGIVHYIHHDHKAEPQ